MELLRLCQAPRRFIKFRFFRVDPLATGVFGIEQGQRFAARARPPALPRVLTSLVSWFVYNLDVIQHLSGVQIRFSYVDEGALDQVAS